jgi:hypothetical protein
LKAAAEAPKTYRIADAAPLVGWSKHTIYRAARRGQIRLEPGPLGVNGKPTLRIEAAEVQRLIEMQRGRGPRHATTALIPEAPP